MGFQFLERRFDPFPYQSYLAERSAQRAAEYEASLSQTYVEITYGDGTVIRTQAQGCAETCPGGLSADEYNAVVAAAAGHMTQGARGETITLLDGGKIRGANLSLELAGYVSKFSPDIILINRRAQDPRQLLGTVNVFTYYPSYDLAHLVAHETAHVHQFAQLGWRRWFADNKELQAEAGRYADSVTYR